MIGNGKSPSFGSSVPSKRSGRKIVSSTASTAASTHRSSRKTTRQLPVTQSSEQVCGRAVRRTLGQHVELTADQRLCDVVGQRIPVVPHTDLRRVCTQRPSLGRQVLGHVYNRCDLFIRRD